MSRRKNLISKPKIYEIYLFIGLNGSTLLWSFWFFLKKMMGQARLAPDGDQQEPCPSNRNKVGFNTLLLGRL